MLFSTKKYSRKITHFNGQDHVDELLKRVAIYKSLGATYGWEAFGHHGDGLLFGCLGAIGFNKQFSVEDARDMDYSWHRNPDRVLNPGYSQISRDMFMGLLFYILHFKRRDLAEQLWAYGKGHGWVMGRTVNFLDNSNIWTPGMVGLLALIIEKLGGPKHGERRMPQFYDASPGFSSHLTMLAILIETNCRGYATEKQLKALDKMRTTHMKNNPMPHIIYHLYKDGDQSEAAKLLLQKFPANRLPDTKLDWREEWFPQRSDTDAQAHPGDEYFPKYSHTGGDFIFLTMLLLGLI